MWAAEKGMLYGGAQMCVESDLDATLLGVKNHGVRVWLSKGLHPECTHTTTCWRQC